MSKKVIFILGPPGSGKGTQGSLLSEKLGFYYFETSKILEKKFNNAEDGEYVEIDKEKFYIEDEKKMWEEGVLNSPPFVTELVKKEIKELYDKGESLILAGSPRTMGETKILLPFLDGLYGKENINTILIKIPAEETVFRNTHRRICELIRHPIIYNEETKELTKCPLDGSNLVRREGLDDPDSIKVRLKENEEKTIPIVDYLKENGVEVESINGVGSVADIFNKILESLKLNES